jgi:hypothetical protein
MPKKKENQHSDPEYEQSLAPPHPQICCPHFMVYEMRVGLELQDQQEVPEYASG